MINFYFLGMPLPAFSSEDFKAVSVGCLALRGRPVTPSCGIRARNSLSFIPKLVLETDAAQGIGSPSLAKMGQKARLALWVFCTKQDAPKSLKYSLSVITYNC